MNRGTLLIKRVVVLVVLAVGTAFAQTDDAYLDRYDLAVGNLQRSVAALPNDAVSAREELDAAFSVLLTLSRETAAGPLAAALERVVERARVAIGNASQDDLAVQVAVLEGGFQRLVFDAALRSAADGDVALARSRLARLAADLGMGQAEQAALADGTQPVSALRFDFEAGVADVIDTRLAVAQELAGTSTGGTYRALARAYGAFLLVQDSPRASTQLNQRFVDAAQALVDDRIDETVTAIADLRVATDAFGDAARARQTPATTPTEPATAAPLELPATVAPTEPTEAATTETATTEPVVDADAAALDPDAVDAELAALDEELGAISAAALAALRLEIEEALHAERVDRLAQELAVLGVPAASRVERAEALLTAGFERVEQAFDAVSAHVVSGLAALQRGDPASARAALARAADAYDALLAPLVRVRAAAVDVDTSVTLRALATDPDLRAGDLTVAASQLDHVARALRGDDEPALLTGARTTAQVWSGITRPIVLLVVGLLALVPLVLSNVAFGGGNRNWQLVGVAMFMLLLPVIFEGVAALGSLLAEFAGVDLLASVSALSPFTSVVGQVVWIALSLMAVLVAIRGLYGICAQFGLVGRRPATAASASSTRSTRSTTKTESIDWDDD